MTVAIKTETSPTLDGSGQFTVTFGDFEKVVSAHVTFDDPQIGDYIFATTTTYATNVVTVTVKKTQASSATPTWAVAITANVASKVFRITADCI